MSSQAVPFSQWLKETMEHRGLNQPRLGALVGVHKNSVNRWVRGERSPALARMPTLAAVDVGA